MGFNRVAAALLSASLVLAAGSAVAEETDAERCAGFPVASEDTVTEYTDKLYAYDSARKQHHQNNDDSAITAWAKAKVDAAFCADKEEDIVEGAEDLYDQLLEQGQEGGEEFIEQGQKWLGDKLEEFRQPKAEGQLPDPLPYDPLDDPTIPRHDI